MCSWDNVYIMPFFGELRNKIVRTEMDEHTVMLPYENFF
jgi:hypothetical protein